jgi:hypothetical protein
MDVRFGFAMKTTGFILALAAAVALTAAPVNALTPSQSAAAAARAHADAVMRARVAAEVKARADAQTAARAKVEAAIAAQKKAAVEVFVRSQAVARVKPPSDAKAAYVVANVAKQMPPGPMHAAPPAMIGSKAAIHRHQAAGIGQHPHHAAAASGHSR